MLGPDVAALDDLQRVEELGPEIVPAPVREAGERRERAHQRPVAAIAAIVRFDAPDGDDGGRVDAVAALRGGERALPFGEHGAAVGNALGIDEARHIVPDRRAELRLLHHQLEHAHVGLEPGGLPVEGGRRRSPALAAAPRMPARQPPKSAAEADAMPPARARTDNPILARAVFTGPASDPGPLCGTFGEWSRTVMVRFKC